MRRDEVNLERIHDYIQKLFIDAGHPEIRDKTLMVEYEDDVIHNRFSINLVLKDDNWALGTGFRCDVALPSFLRELARMASKIAEHFHWECCYIPQDADNFYYLDLYRGARKTTDDILDALRYVSEICKANNARYGVQPLDYTKYCEVLGDKPLEPWKTTCLNKFVINDKKENENMKPTCQMCSPMTKDDIAFKTIMDSVEKERQEKIEAANKEAAKIAADYEEKKHLNNIRAEMKDVAIRYRYLYEELIETGFNEEQSMEIMRDYIKFT